MSVDNNIINKFSGKLNEILQLELEAGNEIAETYEGDWPYLNSVMIFLNKPFITPIQRDLIDIKFRNVNDPHYWKAEYVDLTNRMWLCCGFDGANFELL
jgi:hypothetical protein